MIRTIVIDDEQHFINNLKSLCALQSDIQLVAEARSVEEGVKQINLLKPDLVFLDIEMDDGTGFDLLEQLPVIDFHVIFITAHDQYAIKAFKFSAQDYLLKPIVSNDLFSAIERLREKLNKESPNSLLKTLLENMHSSESSNKKIVLRDAESIHVVAISDIMWCKADGSYCSFTLNNDQDITVSHNLQEYEGMLSEYGFFRVHRSYLVNLHQVKKFSKAEGGTLVLSNEKILPVATRRKDELIKLLSEI